jgi:hypothetical protein
MIIRNYFPVDLKQLSEIHDKFYKDEFPLSDFFNHPFGQVTVTENDKIICAASTREILELIAVTNKDFSVRKRREALLMVLQSSMFLAARTDFNQLHAFIQDEKWMKHLGEYGFKKTKGQSLVLSV